MPIGTALAVVGKGTRVVGLVRAGTAWLRNRLNKSHDDQVRQTLNALVGVLEEGREKGGNAITFSPEDWAEDLTQDAIVLGEQQNRLRRGPFPRTISLPSLVDGY